MAVIGGLWAPGSAGVGLSDPASSFRLGSLAPFPFPWSVPNALCWPVWCGPVVLPAVPLPCPFAHLFVLGWVSLASVIGECAGVRGSGGPPLGLVVLRFWGWVVAPGLCWLVFHLGFKSLRCPSAFPVFWPLLSGNPYIFLTQHAGVLRFLVFAIGSNQSGASGLYDVCVPVIWANTLSHYLVYTTVIVIR